MAEEEPLPSTIGRYAVKRLLGAGAMGSVYLAEDPNIKRRIAIKMVKKGLLLNEADRHEVFARFQREAEVSGLLNHPSIVAIYDFGESEVGTYLAMEFVEGNPLDAVIKSGEALPLTERFRILKGIGEALDHAHSKGIVHRDVKPGNVMIALDGRPKLMDFGIAKREDASLTQTGTFLGTPSYASPEQIREGVVDNRSDVFSFGVMAFELFSGRTPFPGSSINTILYKIVNEPPVMPEPCVDGILPEAWVKIFEKVLAKRPENRYQTCIAFVNDLQHAFSNLNLEARAHLEHPGKGDTVPSRVGIAIDPLSRDADATVSTKRRKPSAAPYLAGIGLPVLALVGFLVYRQVTKAPAKVEPTSATPPESASTPGVVTQSPPTPPPPEVVGNGTVKLAGSFSVRVRVDGRDEGECSPGRTFDLPVGEHAFELTSAKHFYRGSHTLKVSPGKPLTLSLPPLHSILVNTSPGYGLITIDGQATGVDSYDSKPIQVARGHHTFGIQGQSVKSATDVQSDGQVKILNVKVQ